MTQAYFQNKPKIGLFHHSYLNKDSQTRMFVLFPTHTIQTIHLCISEYRMVITQGKQSFILLPSEVLTCWVVAVIA